MLPNGEVFTGGWCRPQTDGPGLRGTTLVLHAQKLVRTSSSYFSNYFKIQSGNIAFVKQYLWTGSSSYNGGAIKYDLDWVAANWQQSGCDLWEEIQYASFILARGLIFKIQRLFLEQV